MDAAECAHAANGPSAATLSSTAQRSVGFALALRMVTFGSVVFAHPRLLVVALPVPALLFVALGRRGLGATWHCASVRSATCGQVRLDGLADDLMEFAIGSQDAGSSHPQGFATACGDLSARFLHDEHRGCVVPGG